ncbi:MAG: hypothetical protein JWO38_775 [Gemmataceae bacterium]|nr:hypothetical protein [Gemmataceae bacterium]
MWRRLTASALFGLGLVAITATGQPPAPAEKKPAEKKAVDPVEGLIESALANDPDVRMARAKIQLAEAELAKARQQVAVKVITLNAAIAEQKRAVVAAQEAYQLINEMHKRGATPLSEVLPARDKLETAKAHLARLETELKLITGAPAGGAAAGPADDLHRTAAARGLACAACHAGSGTPSTAAAALKWLAQHPAPEPIKGPVADRIRAALDKPVRLGTKGEKVSFEKALEAFKKQAGLDVSIRRQDLLVLDSEGKPIPVAPIVSEGEELQVGAWLQLFEDTTGYRFYVREYGLLFTQKSQAPADAVSLVEFWRQKPAAKADEPKK